MAAADGKGAKRRKAEKADVANLQFGDDFEGAEAMLNAEVKIIFDKLNEANQVEFDDLSEMMQNTYKYVETFGEFQDQVSSKHCKE
jgi:hypothetical protein